MGSNLTPRQPGGGARVTRLPSRMVTCPGCGEENPDKFRLCGYCGTSLAPVVTARDVRKTVTVLFCDLEGSTAMGERLDSESLREVMTRYFDELRRIIERHGGTVEKFIGDAVMAVFGLPVVHEDDALRAVRAAFDIQQALEHLNQEIERGWGVRLANRTGVHTGEVVAGDTTTRQRLVTGDTVNVAARLEQNAPSNQVLIGEPTYRLVRDAVVVEAVEPLALKGKSARVGAYRVLEVRDGVLGLARRTNTRLVGRDGDLAVLVDAFTAVQDQGTARAVLVMGDAGLGKSRLVHEFLTRVGPTPIVLRGSCLPYGEGITFWPLVEALNQFLDASQESREDVRAALLRMLGGDDPATERLASVMGLSPQSYPLAETHWAVRRLLEHLSTRGPVVLVLDDLHWAESSLLDLVEHLMLTLGPAPVLLVVATRPELQEARPDWAASRPAGGDGIARDVVTLQPLSVEQGVAVAEGLLGSELPAALEGPVTTTAEGNPLFLEQITSMLVDDGVLVQGEGDDEGWEVVGDVRGLEVPPSVAALATARLDRLDVAERTVLESASVVGRTFYPGAVQELCPAPIDAQVSVKLQVLADKRLVEEEPSTFAQDRVLGFRHLVIRNAAYASLLKRTRAELHQTFVGWLERVTGDRAVEYEEIIGYHLEQAHAYRQDLGPLDDAGRALAEQASQRLASAGRRALARTDMPAAVNLLRRAVTVLHEDDPGRSQLLPVLAEALISVGEFGEADSHLVSALEVAEEVGDERLSAEVSVVRLFGRFLTDPEGWTDQVQRVATSAVEVLQRHGDHAGLAKTWRLLGSVHGLACQYGLAEEAVRQAIEEARAAGDRGEEFRNLPSYALTAAYGPTPVPEAVARCEEILVECEGHKSSEALVHCALGHLRGLAGHFEEARAHFAISRATYDELGLAVHRAVVSLDSAPVEMLAGDHAAAARELEADLAVLQSLGDRNYVATTSALLAQCLGTLGRLDEAMSLTTLSESMSASDDVNSEVEWRSARAKVLARRGDQGTARELAEHAVERALETDFLEVQGNAYLDLAEVLDLSGDPDGRDRARAAGLAALERKGVVVRDGPR
jgi:class 3 adenylate cyclase/tetratricopeptide (TPR) repeat protein